MLTPEDKQAIEGIFNSLFSASSPQELHKITRETNLQWDSMLHVNLIAALEGEFDVFIDLEEAAKVNNLQDCFNLMEKSL